MRLSRADVDLDEGLLAVRESKCRRLRLVPVHSTAAARLRDYASERDRLFPFADSFFVSKSGNALPYSTIRAAFRKLTIQLDWIGRGARPRMHDLRHTFASRVLLAWQSEPEGAEGRIDWLSRYLGHERVSDTYWYLSAVPGLFASAAARFEPPPERSAR